jgi:hypothetical protein
MVRSKSVVTSGQALQLQFADGSVDVVENSSDAKPTKAKTKPPAQDQGALF